MDFLLVASGLLLLLFAGDVLVRGAVALSLRFGVPPLVISLTVVAFGTSAPELLVSIQAALAGAPGIALGNVVGSNIANVLLVLGVPVLIAPIAHKDCDSGRNFLMMMVASGVFIALCFAGPLVWWHGVILLALLGWMLSYALVCTKRARRAGCDASVAKIEDADPSMVPWKIALLIVGGVIGLPLGAQLLVEGARNIAVDAGVSDSAIGLTLVAIGTSAPELATTVMAAVRRHADVAIGNVIGSNFFNLAGIMGVASFFGPLPVPGNFLTVDLWIMLACSALLAPFIFYKWTMGRCVGVALIAAYGVYVAYVLQMQAA